MSSGFSKWVHASLGVLANVIGTIMVLLANAWGSFMMAPAGVDSSGRFLGNYWNVLHTAVWEPFNVHRVVSNIILGAAVMAAYAAFRALMSKTQEEKAHYDWMGYISLIAVVFVFFTFDFGGYWLQRNIYAYRQQMGITLLGGLLAWLNIILVLSVSALFLGINYYLWQRINASRDRDRYGHYAKYVFLILVVCILPYITPHTMVMTPKELYEMGGQQHQVLGNYGVESAKRTAFDIMVVVTMLTLMIWWRCESRPTHSSTYKHSVIVTGFFIVGVANLIWNGIYGYYIPANVRVGLSVPMMATTLSLIILGVATHFMAKRETQATHAAWGTLSVRGYFVLFFLAFALTWIMGLGGYMRSSVRLFWHINELLRDNSPWAFTHTTGFAANVISLNALIFWLGLLLILWLTRLGNKREEKGF